MTKFFALSLLAVTLATGCQAPVGPALPQAPKQLSAEHVRKVLSTSASQASLWGVTFSMSRSYGTHAQEIKGMTSRGRYYDYWQYTQFDNWYDNAAFSGQDSLVKASRARYVYTVPADQVLVLNHAAGTGIVYLNGFGLKTEGANRDIHYMYGPGEQVVLNFSPTKIKTAYSDPGRGSHSTDIYADLTLSGFTINPTLIGQPGVSLGSAK